MASPEIKRQVGQLRHDVDDVYELLDATNETVATIAATQRRHDTRLEEIQQALDLTVGSLDLTGGRLDLTVGRLDRLDQAQHRLVDTQQELADTQRELANAQREQNVKLDAILALLRGSQPSE